MIKINDNIMIGTNDNIMMKINDGITEGTKRTTKDESKFECN